MITVRFNSDSDILHISLYLWITDVSGRSGWWQVLTSEMSRFVEPLSVWSLTLDFLATFRRFLRDIADVKPSPTGWSESNPTSREREIVSTSATRRQRHCNNSSKQLYTWYTRCSWVVVECLSQWEVTRMFWMFSSTFASYSGQKLRLGGRQCCSIEEANTSTLKRHQCINLFNLSTTTALIPAIGELCGQTCLQKKPMLSYLE